MTCSWSEFTPGKCYIIEAYHYFTKGFFVLRSLNFEDKDLGLVSVALLIYLVLSTDGFEDVHLKPTSLPPLLGFAT